jgi:DNA (cytosine-5)-methyltransferase 1
MDTFSNLRLAAALSIPEAAKVVGVTGRTAYRWEYGEVPATADALDTLRARVAAPLARPSAKFTFIDLFAGIGGLRRGFDTIGGRCVFSSEWNIEARITYFANYYDGPDHVFARDLRRYEADDLPEHDVLLARMAADSDALQILDLFQIIRHHLPKVIVIELTAGRKSEASGSSTGLMQALLQEQLGYHLSERSFDAQCVVPQRRNVVFLTGVHRDDGEKIDLDALALPSIAAGPRLNSILHAEDGSDPEDPDYLASGKVDARYTLSDTFWKILQNRAQRYSAKDDGFSLCLVEREDIAQALSGRCNANASDILLRQDAARNPRRLTPRECSRLMGFDRPGHADFVIPVSDTEAYVQFGTATVVPVAEALSSHILPSILGSVSG